MMRDDGGTTGKIPRGACYRAPRAQGNAVAEAAVHWECTGRWGYAVRDRVIPGVGTACRQQEDQRNWTGFYQQI